MTGAGGNIGGGACSRSITDFATSAAERMPVAWVRAFAGRRGLIIFGAFSAAFFGSFFGLFFGAAWGIFRVARTGCVADDLRTAGLSLSVAAGRGRAWPRKWLPLRLFAAPVSPPSFLF